MVFSKVGFIHSANLVFTRTTILENRNYNENVYFLLTTSESVFRMTMKVFSQFCGTSKMSENVEHFSRINDYFYR